jgi:tetratricopeptide (TPR) repeat protein
VTALVPDDGEAAGLLALMLLTEARRPARVSPDGELLTLVDQDRTLWNTTLITEGHAIVRARLDSGQAPGPYQILAAINAVHTDAHHVSETDWAQIVALYDQLVHLDPSPIIALNRAIALAELDGADVALAIVDRLDERLATYRPYHTARAELLRRLGRTDDAIAEYDRAIGLGGNTAETRYLQRRRHELGSASDAPDSPSRSHASPSVSLRHRARRAPRTYPAGRASRPDPGEAHGERTGAARPIDRSGSSARRRNIARALATLLRPTRSSSAFRDERRDPPSTASEPHRTSDAIGDERIRFAGQRVDARPPATAGRPSACTHASRRASR